MNEMSQEKYDKQIESLLLEKRSYTTEIPFNENVVSLMTGGLDSSIGAELCIKKWDTTIYPLYIKRGATAQKHEIKALKGIYNYLKFHYPENIKKPLFINAAIPASEIKSFLKKERIFSKGHPLRNTIMQMYGIQYGVMLNDKGLPVRSLIVGSVGSDFYPGSRASDLLLNTLTVSQNLGEWKWQIISPFHMGLIKNKKIALKEDLINWGLQNNFPFELTRTCTRKNTTPCGECNECKERIKTFKKEDHEDPITYAI
jgi:7-cyano-7-deazaguanine synthase in queuosine biosynthesis